jgi:hypothetical protein
MRDALGSHADHPLPLQRSIAELVPLRSRTISPSPNTDARAIRSQSRDENYAERAATQRAQKHRRRLSTVRRMDRLVVLEHGRTSSKVRTTPFWHRVECMPRCGSTRREGSWRSLDDSPIDGPPRERALSVRRSYTTARPDSSSTASTAIGGGT